MKLLSLKQSQKAARFLKEGKVIIFPTDTVYGLLADVTNKNAVQKLYRIKKRPLKKPFPLFVGSIAAAKQVARINKKQELYIKRRWPGKTTVVLKRKSAPRLLYGVSRETIALRQPNYKPLLSLLRKATFPLTATSANVAGRAPAKTLTEAVAQFQSQKLKPDAAVDGGILNGKPSTIVDLTQNPYRILRK